VSKISIVRAAALLLIATTTAVAQENQPEPAAGRPLRVQLVINKQLGEKKVSSLAYTFPCNDRKTTVKLGVEVPVPVRKGGDLLEFQYRNVGANFECEARPMAEGRFGVRISFEQSSLYPPSDKTPTVEATLESRAANPPMFRTTMGQLNVALRDGQTTQAITGTDPVSGEVTAVDITLNVLK
jgi:hypothetical protein